MQITDHRLRQEILTTRAARMLAALVMAIGCFVLVGWLFEIEVLKSLLHPGRTAMNPLTAIEFIFAATALSLHTFSNRSRARLAFVLGIVVACVAMSRVIAYATEFDAGIDRMLFTERLGTNVMAPNTAIAFLCVGIALVLIDVNTIARAWIGRIALLAAGWITLLSLTGYVYNIRPLYGVTGYIPMALNTALAFAMLCAGILVARPRREPLATILGIGAGGETARRLLPAALLVPLVLGFLWLEAERNQLFELEYGLSIYALANVLTLSVLIWLGSRSIARVDAQRLRATEQLRDASIAAEGANRAKSSFLANMSHEIRTPMNGVLGMLELMRNTGFTGQQREYLGIAQQSAEALLRLLNDILDFSKIEAGKLELEAIVFPLRDMLAETLQSQTVRAAAKDIELAYSIPSDVPDGLIGDPGRLRQVLSNLAGNAIKFTERGEIVVRVRMLEQSEKDVALEFSVRDTGIGIDTATIAHLFLPFNQADTSTTRRYGGSGLGLAISRELVALMGGEIDVDSTPGVGSTFRFTAHFGVGPATSPRTLLSAEALRRLEVLIVDDNATNRLILSEMLSNWGMNPHAVDGGATALDYLDAYPDTPPRLILLDAMMAGMDGFTLARRMRERVPKLNATIIMLSSGVESIDCDAHGVARCLTKPVKQSDLFDAIVESLHIEGNVDVEHELDVATELVAPRNVLLVEDGLVNQAVAANLLRRRGHHVSIANNGLEALGMVALETFDIVLMDVQMPVMDGFEATARIREREATTGEHLPIVAMTAHAMRGDRERCLAAGMDGYLTKPVIVSELQAAVEEVEVRSTFVGARERISAVDILSRFGGDLELVRDVAGLFGESVAGWTAELRSACEHHDADAIARIAHMIKGSVGNFTTIGAYELAARIEASARSGEANCDDDAARLERELHELASTLQSMSQSAS